MEDHDDSGKLALQPVFQRAVLDRNMTINPDPMRAALAKLDLSGLAILDFGCGNGNLLRLLRETDAEVIYAFEVMPQYIDPDIQAWAADPDARPRLVINPPDCKIDPALADGDLTNYDYFRLLAPHQGFGIVSNPPYFLYNRILSLTGTNLASGHEAYEAFHDKFRGALMITSRGRLCNHPGWEIKAVMKPDDFDPPAINDQYLVQTGFGQAPDSAFAIPRMPGAQLYLGINNRRAEEDESDFYPDMWEQLNNVPRLGL